MKNTIQIPKANYLGANTHEAFKRNDLKISKQASEHSNLDYRVTEIYVAIVQEKHLEYKTLDWNAYIINNSTEELETVLIVSKGYNDTKITPPMRHTISKLPAKSYAKIEYLQEQVLKLNNEFKITFFKNNQLFDKNYVFKKNSINEKALQTIPLMTLRGVLIT